MDYKTNTDEIRDYLWKATRLAKCILDRGLFSSYREQLSKIFDLLDRYDNWIDYENKQENSERAKEHFGLL